MRILFHSNAPWLKSGYGQQTAIWAPRLRDLGHDVAIAGYAGAQHLAVEWEGIKVYPAGSANAIGMDGLSYYYDDHRADVVISLCDAWALSPRLMSLMPTVCWTPVDAEPLSQGLADFFRETSARPVAMSRYGQRIFAAGPNGDGSDGIEAAYIPHGLPSGLFKPPEDRAALRAASGIDEDTFVVLMNQANRSGFRKALSEQAIAFARFHRRHPDSRLLLHMAKDHPKGQDMPLLLRKLGVGEGVAFFPDQGAYAAGVIGMEEMPGLYGAADVTLAAAMAGGFELPIAESQLCGTPVIATDSSAMTEVAGPHSWLVPGQDFWVEQRHEGFWSMPLIGHTCSNCGHLDGIEAALEDAWALWNARMDGRWDALRQTSREHAMQYDADTVLRDYWVPFLAELEDDLTAKRPRKQAAPRTVWSPVMFRDELDMLEMRLHETDGLIDRHVIVEAETTHRGVPKPLYFRDSSGRFEAHASRITAVAGGALPDEQPWVNEHLQRDAAWTVIDAEAS